MQLGPTLRIGIIVCDSPPPKTDEAYGGYGGLFTDLLKRAAETQDPRPRLEVSAWDALHKQEYPPDDQVDAVLLTGAKYDSFDNAPWILKLVEYTKRLLTQQSRIRVIGVCFGHQIIGRALGKVVGRSPAEWEISCDTFVLTPRGKALFFGDESDLSTAAPHAESNVVEVADALAEQRLLHIHQMHRDVVFEYPEELPATADSAAVKIEPLGSSPRCRVQGMYAAGRMISVQGHPEFDEHSMLELLVSRHDKGLFTDELFEDAMARRQLPHDGLRVAQAFLKTVEV